MGGVIHSVIQPNMMRLTEEVREGKLDHALTKPVDAQMLVWFARCSSGRPWTSSPGAVVIGFALFGSAAISASLDVLAFGVALVLGAVLLYCFWLVLATGSFWVVHMWFLPELFEGDLPDGSLAGRHLPDWLRFGITFLVPIAFAVTVPAEAVTSRLDWQTLTFAAVFTVAAFAFTRWFWRFGLRRYSGASA